MQFLNARELAARWRVSAKTLERWRCEGSGPVYLKLHGKILYRMADVESFEDRRCRVSSSSAIQGQGA